MTARRAIGDFEGRTLVGSFDPVPATYSHLARPFGLTLDATYIYGTFRDEDDNLYSAVRRITTSGDTSPLAVLQSADTTSDLRVLSDVAQRCFVGKARVRIGEDDVRYGNRLAYSPEMSGFEATLTPSRIQWIEGTDLDLDGRILGPGLQFFTPWSSGALLYTSRLWLGGGTILGRPVTGFLGLDQLFAPAGLSWSHEPVSRQLELSWFTWGNQYDDGTIETGHIAFGHGHWGFAMFNTDSGELYRSTAVDSLIDKRDEAGWPLQISYRVDGEDWEWIADPRGRMPDFGVPGKRVNPNSEGQFRRVGEKRAITTWFAWGETVPSNGDARGPAPMI